MSKTTMRASSFGHLPRSRDANDKDDCGSSGGGIRSATTLATMRQSALHECAPMPARDGPPSPVMTKRMGMQRNQDSIQQ
jgi:hypothetical protein